MDFSECRTLMIVPGLDARNPFMRLDTVVVEGTLKPDGSLELDTKPALTPGRVQVTILPLRAPDLAQPRGTILAVLKEIRSPRKPGAIAAVRSRRWKRMRPNGERRRKSMKSTGTPSGASDVRSSIRRDGGMIVYLDSVIVIYLIEGPDPFRVRAEARLAQITAANDQVATSHLTRLECRVEPIRLNDASLLADYEAFFNNPDLRKFPSPEPVFERATVIRAKYNLKLGDSLRWPLRSNTAADCS